MNQMFTTNFEKQYKEFEAQAKQVRDYWLDLIITNLKQLQK